MLNITRTEKVLHIGYGALPFVTIFMKLAQLYAKNKYLPNPVTIEYGDSVIYPVHIFDVMCIAINTWSIDCVL